MQISTKRIASLAAATSAAVVSGAGWRKKPRYERILQRHDRRGEIRAELLGTTPEDYRELQKKVSFEEVVRRHGFLNERAFQIALLGKLRMELRQRGWTSRRIDDSVSTRRQRLTQ